MKNYIKYFKYFIALFWLFAASFTAVNASDKSNTLFLYHGSEPPSFDPQLSSSTTSADVLRNLLEGLVVVNSEGNTVPGVAESWSNEDYKVWTFKLRKNAKWSDGSPVTAHDFVYSFRRLVNPAVASPYSSYLGQAAVVNAANIVDGKAPIESLGVKALDDYTLEITLENQVPYFVDMLIHTSVKPVKKEVVEKYGDRWVNVKNFVGNGAYVLAEHVVNEKHVLKRNPHYWDNANTNIETVVFYIINDPLMVYNRYKAGELSVIGVGMRHILNNAKKEFPDQYRTMPKMCSSYFEINHNKIKDKRVRKALSLGVDRDIFTKNVLSTGELSAYGLTSPFIKGSNFTQPEWASWSAKQRHEEARKLLAEAGYNAKNPLKITYFYTTSESNRLMAVALSAMLRKNIGVEVKLEHQEWKTFLQQKREGNFELAMSGWCADYNEPSAFLNILLSNSTNNNGRYKSDKFDEFMDKAMKSSNEEERMALYQQAENQILEDGALVPLFFSVNNILVRPGVNYNTSPFGQTPVHFMSIK